MKSGLAVSQKNFAAHFLESRVAVSSGKVPGLAHQRWEMYRAGLECWSLRAACCARSFYFAFCILLQKKIARCVM